MSPARGDGRFPSTQWSLIKRLRSPDEATARRALDDLVAQYHFPLYCVIRHRGLAHHDAEDALHDFLAKLLRLDSFAGADVEKGRLRAFLSTALGRFLSNWHRDRAARAREVSLDSVPGEDGARGHPASEARYRVAQFPDHETPERLFDRQWACELFARVLVQVDGARRANSFNYYRKVVNVDAQPVKVTNTPGTQFTIESLPVGATVKITVTGVNDAGEGLASEAVGDGSV